MQRADECRSVCYAQTLQPLQVQYAYLDGYGLSLLIPLVRLGLLVDLSSAYTVLDFFDTIQQTIATHLHVFITEIFLTCLLATLLVSFSQNIYTVDHKHASISDV